MTFEEASEAWELYHISPELTCQCDEELGILCQQCMEELRNERDVSAVEDYDYEG